MHVKTELFIKRADNNMSSGTDVSGGNRSEELSKLVSEIRHELFNLDFEEHGRNLTFRVENLMKNMKYVCNEVDKGYEEMIKGNSNLKIDQVAVSLNGSSKEMTSTADVSKIMNNFGGMVDDHYQLL